MKTIRCVTILTIGLIFLIGINAHPVFAEEMTVVSRGELFTLTATLFSNGTSGTLLPNQVVYFFDQSYDELMSSAITDGDGVASIDYSFDHSHPLGPTLINITFIGNESIALAPSCQWLTLMVTSLTTISITASNAEYAPNDHLKFSSILYDDSGNPVNNAELSILSDSEFITSDLTNTTGHVIFDVILDFTNFSLGQHTIDVVYGGDQSRFYRGSTISFQITIDQLSTTIELNDITNNLIMLNQTWTASIQLLTEESSLAYSPIDLHLDGTYLYTLNTDALGSAEIRLHINQTFEIGEHVLVFEYPGSYRYLSSATDVIINVGSPIYLNMTPLNLAEIGGFLKLRITAYDLYSRPLSHGAVQVSDNLSSSNVTATISNTPTIEVLFPVQGEIGIRTFKAQITNGVLLTNNTNFLIIDIFSRPHIEISDTNILGYAYPSQTWVLSVHLHDYRGNLSNRFLEYYFSGVSQRLTAITGIDGMITIEVICPDLEGDYFLHVTYEGNTSEYELPCNQTLAFTVSQKIPIVVSLEKYEIITPLNTIEVTLRLQSLNGTYPKDVVVIYQWLSIDSSKSSGLDGYLDIQLPIPSNSGVHSLMYEIAPTNGILSHSGIIYIIITSTDANASEGIGLYGIIIGFVGSVCIFSIPLVRRRLIVH
ncbi:MAG: hypothetical protein P1Q69_00455 [Candidatus Thorarchaeota archaeon]|nr:hypothetical protein [Candidatus Thorarchaeota archaeon]